MQSQHPQQGANLGFSSTELAKSLSEELLIMLQSFVAFDMGWEEVVYPYYEEAVDDGVGRRVAFERILQLFCQDCGIHHGRNSFLDDVLVEWRIVENGLGGIKPEEDLFGTLKGHLDTAQNGHPWPRGGRVASNILLKDADELLLKSIGDGVVVGLVLFEVGLDGGLDVVGQRQDGLGNVCSDDLGQVLDGAARVGPISKVR